MNTSDPQDFTPWHAHLIGALLPHRPGASLTPADQELFALSKRIADPPQPPTTWSQHLQGTAWDRLPPTAAVWMLIATSTPSLQQAVPSSFWWSIARSPSHYKWNPVWWRPYSPQNMLLETLLNGSATTWWDDFEDTGSDYCQSMLKRLHGWWEAIKPQTTGNVPVATIINKKPQERALGELTIMYWDWIRPGSLFATMAPHLVNTLDLSTPQAASRLIQALAANLASGACLDPLVDTERLIERALAAQPVWTKPMVLLGSNDHGAMSLAGQVMAAVLINPKASELSPAQQRLHQIASQQWEQCTPRRRSSDVTCLLSITAKDREGPFVNQWWNMVSRQSPALQQHVLEGLARDPLVRKISFRRQEANEYVNSLLAIAEKPWIDHLSPTAAAAISDHLASKVLKEECSEALFEDGALQGTLKKLMEQWQRSSNPHAQWLAQKTAILLVDQRDHDVLNNRQAAWSKMSLAWHTTDMTTMPSPGRKM